MSGTCQPYQQQGWYPSQPYGGGYGGGSQPPKNGKTGLWIGIAVAVVVVVAVLGITGFVAPGFFLGKDSSNTTAQTQNPAPPARTSRPQPTESSLPTEETAAPGAGGSASADGKQIVDDFVAKRNAKDASGALARACKGGNATMRGDIDEVIGGDPQLTVEDYRTSTRTADVGGSLSGRDAHGSVLTTNVYGGWCVDFCYVLAY
ncbi:hypothetical protein [Amycolatopsis sp. FDAARGOS 1241]|uniref:hypothetical protein n=1 Tax=Amycolatopsis sp. FDAARGOS 1241 TaxID=2778070 RepID=UPI0019514B7B|nr:hypothetical protein [Amycolatopsis sp. FDAARGOS 1241]QRP49091.1 hypothetical protein I6J71_15620 [Amycolatopsis sp. FDAARGOS 1241]